MIMASVHSTRALRVAAALDSAMVSETLPSSCSQVYLGVSGILSAGARALAGKGVRLRFLRRQKVFESQKSTLPIQRILWPPRCVSFVRSSVRASRQALPASLLDPHFFCPLAVCGTLPQAHAECSPWAQRAPPLDAERRSRSVPLSDPACPLLYTILSYRTMLY